MRARSGCLLAFLVASCASPSRRKEPESSDTIQATAALAITALRSHDMAALAPIVDSARGLRFSPYPFVDTAKDVGVPQGDVASLWENPAIREWGTRDGSGAPIRGA